MEEMYDEQWIKLKNEYKSQTIGNIKDGMIMEENKIEFEQQSIFDNKIKISIPAEFNDIQEEYAKMKYPMENRPKIIKSNDTTDVNICFNIMPEKINHDNIKQFTNKLQKLIKRVNPTNVFYETKYINLDGNCKDNLYDIEDAEKDRVEISFFDFRSTALDDILYNINAFVFLENEVIFIVCNCIYKDNEKWKPVFVEILKSIRRGE